jgi:hypothetical protein
MQSIEYLSAIPANYEFIFSSLYLPIESPLARVLLSEKLSLWIL